MQLKPDTLLDRGKYRIIKPLGMGGFGVTYLAEQVMAKRKVCIKEFFPKDYYVRDEGVDSISILSKGQAELMSRFKAKFIKEAQIIAALDHPNIIHIHDIFEDNNTAYYAMDYIEGDSLNALVKSHGVLSEADAVKYIREIASALDYIHERKIMHLDIKPSNVMVSQSDDHSVLIDFGLSKHYDEHSGEATSTTPVGVSHGYAPMEQYKQGGVKNFSPETDIYSLGATMFYLLTGSVPPQAADVAYDGLPEMPAHLSQSVRNAISHAMAWNLKERPHSIKEFLSLLDGSAPMAAAATVASIPEPASTLAQPLSEETVVPTAEGVTTDEKTEMPTPKRSEATPMQSIGYNRNTLSSIIHNITLIGASLQFVITFGLTNLFRGISYDAFYSEGGDIEAWFAVATIIYMLLSVALLVAVILRKNSVAMTLSIGSLISCFVLNSGFSEMHPPIISDEADSIVCWLTLLSILTTGIGAGISQYISPQNSIKPQPSTQSYGSTILLTILFALLWIIPRLNPTWELDAGADVDRVDRGMKYIWDYIYVNIGYLTSIIGIAGIVCRRYKMSLVAALFALVGMFTATLSKYTVKSMIDNSEGYYDYLRESKGINIDVNDYSLTLANYFPIVIAIVIIGIIFKLYLTEQSKDERWSSTMPIVAATLLIILGWCGYAISTNMFHGGYSRLSYSHADYTVYYNIASVATLIFAVCRQYLATVVSSLITALLSLIIISKASDVESSLIVYGAVVSAIATMLFAIYNMIYDRRGARLDVIIATVVLLAIYYAYEGISNNFGLGVYDQLVWIITPISFILIYSLRRNWFVALFMILLIFVIIYIIGNNALDNFDDYKKYMPDDYKSRCETLILISNIAKVLLVGVVYSVIRDFIKRDRSTLSANDRLS